VDRYREAVVLDRLSGEHRTGESLRDTDLADTGRSPPVRTEDDRVLVRDERHPALDAGSDRPAVVVEALGVGATPGR